MVERRAAYPLLLAERGLPSPEPETMAALRDIVDEGVLGASNHVTRALPLVAGTAGSGRPRALEEALLLAGFISGTRGLAAPVVANALAWLTQGVEGLAPADAAARLRDRAAAWDARAAERRAALIRHAVAALSAVRSPLLFDYSSTVADVIRGRAAAGGFERLVVPESRAIDGGRRYVEALGDLAVPIRFLPDAAMEYAVGLSDAVLLGAESVTRDGGIVNTVGSLPAARAAAARGVPVYGAADLFKVGPAAADDLPPPDVRSYDFLGAGAFVATEAPELEIVPPAFIDAVLTEAGPLPPSAVATAARRAGAPAA